MPAVIKFTPEAQEYCSLLQISIPFNKQDLKKAYRRMVFLYHPDRNRTADSEVFRAIQEAYEKLITLAEDNLTDTTLETICGTPLSELGLGLGTTINGKDCSFCNGNGYTSNSRNSYRVCTRCDWLGRTRLQFPCRSCNATGSLTLHTGHQVTCRVCKGTKVWTHPIKTMVCPSCHGTKTVWLAAGTVTYHICHMCDGKGEVPIFNPVLPKGRIL